jgi:hypothetical protein
VVAPHDLARRVDQADAVGVAVEGDARSAPSRRTAAIRSCTFSTTVGSGWWFGKVPSLSRTGA